MKSRIPLPVKKTVVPKFEESVGRERAKFDFQRTSDSCKNKKLYIICLYIISENINRVDDSSLMNANFKFQKNPA